MKNAIMWGVSVAVMTCAANAAADSPKLKGEYGYTGSASCLLAPFGFNSSFEVVDGNSRSSSSNVEGIRTFNGDGTGTDKSTTLTLTVPPTPGFQPNAGSSSSSFSFTYTVSEDGGWTANVVPGANKGTVLTGPRAGQTFTVQNGAPVTGLISRDGSTLTVADLTPTVETITYSDGFTIHRICQRSRVFIKLKDDDGDR
jgi:hypothetical protein